jgi:peptidyl-prolyl cis-trans isomerase C
MPPLPGTAPATRFARLGREPLVHFLLIGLLLFVLYGALGGEGAERRIRVDDTVAAALYAQFENTRQRPPTAEEMEGLVEAHVRDEIFYREGVALGLDRGDPTIRRRVGQKYATIAEESEAAAPASNADLQRWLDEHADRYAEPALVSFDQIAFVSPSDSGAAAIESARTSLAAGTDWRTLGSGRMLLPHYELYPLDLVGRDFGPEFARALVSLEPGEWQGPVRSGYGVHLVRIGRTVPGRAPELAEVRAAVARDYEQARRARSLDTAYRRLREVYRIDYSGEWQPARRP